MPHAEVAQIYMVENPDVALPADIDEFLEAFSDHFRTDTINANETTQEDNTVQ